MISNEREYAIARASMERFQRALSEFSIVDEIERGVDPKIASAQKESFAFQVDQLGDEIRRYEILKKGLAKSIKIDGLDGIGAALIETRIASGLSQKMLANRAGIQEQQIQRYEKDLYRSASLRRLSLICSALDSEFSGFIDPPSTHVEAASHIHGIPVDEFPFAEARRANWFGTEAGVGRSSEEEKHKVLVKYFAEAPAISGNVLHRKTAGTVNQKRRAAILLWQARVLQRAAEVAHHFPRFHPLNSDALRRLVRLSLVEDDFEEGAGLLREHGIIVVCQQHLKGTKLDGAALSLKGKQAVLALTLRHNRLDNFWFNLLHELGHLTRHWPHVSSRGIVDEDIGAESNELLEREADEFARNAVISDDAWSDSMVRYSNDDDVVIRYAAKIDVHPALVAGRIRHERGYARFSKLVGQGVPQAMMAKSGLWGEEHELG